MPTPSAILDYTCAKLEHNIMVYEPYGDKQTNTITDTTSTVLVANVGLAQAPSNNKYMNHAAQGRIEARVSCVYTRVHYVADKPIIKTYHYLRYGIMQNTSMTSFHSPDKGFLQQAGNPVATADCTDWQTAIYFYE